MTNTKTAAQPAGNLDPKWGAASLFHEPALLAGFRPRATDVLITTAPKAGTTWMQQILYQLRSGGDESFDNIFDVVPWLEYRRPGVDVATMLRDYEAMSNPRIFKTHCTYEQTPGTDTVRIVMTSRDPRDCCVSYYHHMINLADPIRDRLGVDENATFDDLFERWLAGGAWFRNIQSWWPHRTDANVLWLRYEDMKRDLEQAVDSIVGFLGWTLEPDQKARVLEHCSFEWMKRHNAKFSAVPGYTISEHFEKGGLIRKGKVGDYKTLLSKQQEQRILDQAREMLEPECLVFLGLVP